MNDGLIPQRYAKALYKYALEKGTSADIYREMAAVASAFDSEPKLQKVLANPFVTAADKEKLLISAAVVREAYSQSRQGGFREADGSGLSRYLPQSQQNSTRKAHYSLQTS